MNPLKTILNQLSAEPTESTAPVAAEAAAPTTTSTEAATSAATSTSAHESAVSGATQAVNQAGEQVGSMADAVTQAAGEATTQVAEQLASQPGMFSFIEQSDMVGKSLFVILCVMSLITWYLIFVKGISNKIQTICF